MLVICVDDRYTSLGGVQAVAWTDVKQMVIIVAGMCAAVAILVFGITRNVGFGRRCNWRATGGSGDRFRFDLRETYVLVWNDRRLFLMLAYFGCDRPGAALSHGEVGGRSLRFPAHERVRKIPLQLLILSTGVLVFVFICSRRRRCCSTGPTTRPWPVDRRGDMPPSSASSTMRL